MIDTTNPDSTIPAQSVDLRWNLSDSANLSMATMLGIVAERGLAYLECEDQVAGEGTADALDDLGALVRRVAHRGSVSWVFRFDLGDAEAFALVRLVHNSIRVEAAGATRADARAARDRVVEALEPVQEAPDDEVHTMFWSRGEHGAHNRTVATAVPLWSEIADNYAKKTREQMVPLVGADSAEGGRLILWHGEPGTGKTSALRALMREWQDWCGTHVVSDPEEFLASGNSYMLDVLTIAADSKGIDREWALIVLEDAGELMASEARDRSGQALSRLLNLTDGLLGQSHKAIVILTTNEPLSRLHPAVHRPGRCWAEVEFAPLGVAEANRWLSERNSPARVNRATPIAELYAHLKGESVRSIAEPEFGFGRALAG